ncbi:MAG: family 78 glycoside hydrolase catalytic domain [Bacteroidetes bacterium]|nr:family 78 glycoside hydrolase catalytic domain [Bacteroidota bacterium]
MKNHKILLAILLFTAVSLYGKAQQCKPQGLVCEYMVNPIGIDAANPRLKWQINDQRPGALQQAYQIFVGADSLAVLHGEGNMMNSTLKVGNDMLITYQGKPLAPFTKYYWTVQVWDMDGKKCKPATVASFETGMMEMKNWKGFWISDTQDINLKAAPYFRKVFRPTSVIKSARAYIAVAGLYELYINGKRVGNHRLDPMYTRFDRRNLYATYDITSMLNTDSVAVGVVLGNGWYNHQSTAVWYFDKAPWRARPKFCMDIRITYENGAVETITTGEDWKTSLSPITLNSIYTAEHQDARLAQKGWNNTPFNDSKWKNSIIVGAPSNNIVAQVLHPIRDIEEIPAKSIRKISAQKYIFDLGRNIAGVSKIHVTGEQGTVLRLKHSELLDKDGNVDQSNIIVHYRPTDDTDPFQTDIYTLSGEGVETFMPHFNYKGFQYVEVSSDKPIELTKESLTGIFMHSDVPVAGQIQSSNTTLNKTWSATNNSYLSNLFGYPTDCPQREKNGWTGDAHIASETGLYNFDGITIYEKWLADHRDEQQPNGVLPAIVPSDGWGYAWANGPDWTSTIAIIPWNIYQFYGDSKLLTDCYDNIKRYVDHITEISPSGLTNWGLGDWVPVKSVTPKEFTSSIYYFVDASILAKTALILKKQADYERYTALSNRIANAINAKYLDQETGVYGEGLQTELSAPLFWGVVPENLKAKVAEKLAQRVIADNRHIDVGLLGSKTILNALSENGYADLAYEVASQETFPSWGWWIKNGATTLLENWPIDAKSDISQNHIMFGEIGAWYYKALGGIKPDPQNPGFKNTILQPNFVKGLESFEAKHTGPYGEIKSSWKRKDNSVIYSAVIPANSTVTLYLNAKSILKDGKVFSNEASVKNGDKVKQLFTIKLNSGSYVFTVMN